MQKNKEDISKKLNESNKKHLKAVTQHETDLNSLKASLHILEDEVKVQKEAVTSGNETIVLKVLFRKQNAFYYMMGFFSVSV